ncbi:hypothetical protein C0J52_23005 [Blattella germanica]|nr:hypothetical protein C0J52_23005 [Blattella germanica]
MTKIHGNQDVKKEEAVIQKSPTTATNMVCQQVQWNSGPAQGERANHLIDGPKRVVEGTAVTRLRSGMEIHKNHNKNNSNRGFYSVFNKNNNSVTNVNK